MILIWTLKLVDQGGPHVHVPHVHIPHPHVPHAHILHARGPHPHDQWVPDDRLPPFAEVTAAIDAEIGWAENVENVLSLTLMLRWPPTLVLNPPPTLVSGRPLTLVLE